MYELTGLTVVEIEFNSLEESENFIMPDFCLRDVTDEKRFATGLLVGKSFEDIREICS